MKFKRLSTYGSVGTGILIPIYGKTDADYIVGDKSAYTTDWKLTLPDTVVCKYKHRNPISVCTKSESVYKNQP